jgi:Uma2 family endonuclease
MNHSSLNPTTTKTQKNLQPNDRREAGKIEVLDGRTSVKHASNRWNNLITANFAIAIGTRIQRNNCEIYAGDMQVQVGKNSVCFPNLVIVSGEPVFSDNRFEVLQNPTVVIEVFAGSSRSGDRTQKLEGFLSSPSIKEFLLVNQTEMRVEHYARQNSKQWIYRIYNERDDTISLDSIQCKLSLSEVYAQVKLGESELSLKTVH